MKAGKEDESLSFFPCTQAVGAYNRLKTEYE
jgi:hypothetical protein